MDFMIGLLTIISIILGSSCIAIINNHLFGCTTKKKNKSSEDKKSASRISAKKVSDVTPSNDDEEEDKKKGSAVVAGGKKAKGKSKEKKNAKGKKEDDDDLDKSLKPRSMIPKNNEELEAVKKIKQGKVRAAKDNETVEDAASDWGHVKSMEERSGAADENPDKKKKRKK